MPWRGFVGKARKGSWWREKSRIQEGKWVVGRAYGEDWGQLWTLTSNRAAGSEKVGDGIGGGRWRRVQKTSLGEEVFLQADKKGPEGSC